MSQIYQELQDLESSASVSLFTLDASSVGGPVLHFTTNASGNTPISFNGIVYVPIDVKFDGLETSGVGALPQPTLTLANTDSAPDGTPGVIQAIVNSYGDLNGCTVTRVRTYARFLDGQPEADPLAYIGPDVFRVEQKTADTPTEIVWTLSASIDEEEKMLPGRVIVRDTCMARYRVWNPLTLSFDYSKAQCPYTGSQSYDINDAPVSNALDKPSRGISCCKTRFGDGNPLPYWGFPGVARSLT